MFIPINEVGFDSAAEKILPELTGTVDNISNCTPWTLNAAVWYLFLPSFLSKRNKQI